MATVTTEETLKDRIIASGIRALEVVDGYLAGTSEDREKAITGFRILSQAVKVMQQNQVRQLTERSQALRLIPYLPKDARNEYIELTNPQVKTLLLDRPKSVGLDKAKVAASV